MNVPTCPAAGNLANTAFDDANRLARYENWANADNHVTLDYGYDGDGNRLFQKYGRYRYNYATAMDDLIESDYTQYQYANGKVLNERNNSGVPVWYIRDPYGNLLYTLHWRSSSLKPDMYVQDHLGSVRMIVDYTGAVTNKITYDAFGAITSSATTLRNSYEFTGLPRDAKSGLNYAYARYYKPGLGRFITQDTWKGNPWQPWTQNLYAYVGNNPVNFIDPTGYMQETTNDGGGDCAGCGSDTATVGVQTFIPFKWVGPFMGDDHELGQGGTYRTQHIVDVDFASKSIRTVIQVVSPTTYVTGKKTEAGDPTQLKLADVVWSDNAVTFALVGSAPSPACQSTCPSIDYSITYSLHRQDDGTVTVSSASGQHNPFPAYETFVISGKKTTWYYGYRPPWVTDFIGLIDKLGGFKHFKYP